MDYKMTSITECSGKLETCPECYNKTILIKEKGETVCSYCDLYKIEDLRLIIDSIFDEITILDTSYNIVDVNKTFCEKYKVSKEDVIGKKCFKFTHGLNHICKHPECKCPATEVLRTKKFSESIHTHYKNGREIFLELRAYPIKTKEGKVKKIVKIGRDITEQEKKN